jgi:hypothetical protein
VSVGDLLFSVRDGRSMRRAATYSVVLVPVALMAMRGFLASGPPPAASGHADLSLNLALSRALCGVNGAISPVYSVYQRLNAHPSEQRDPLVDVLARQAGSRHAYCASVTQPFVNNENSLMWLERAALAVRPRLSLAEAAAFLFAVRVGMLWLFGFALLTCGASLWLAGTAIALGVAILTAVDLRYETYPFLLTAPLAMAGVYTLMWCSGRDWPRGSVLVVTAAGCGFLTAFGANFRTSQLPAYLAMAVTFVYLQARRDRPADRSTASHRVPRPAAWAASFVAGYLAFHAVMIAPLRPNTSVPNYTYHAVSHSLVIGLGVPETDFSRSEGLHWDDNVGFAIARRAGVQPLGPDYEKVLLRYYARLWRRHPGAMARTYFTKFRYACSEVFLSAGIVLRPFGVTSPAFEWLHLHTDGFALLMVVAGVGALGWRACARGSSLGFLVLLLALAALLTLLESALTYSTFSGMYFSSLLFFLLFSAAAAVQSTLDFLAAAMWPWPRQRVTGV